MIGIYRIKNILNGKCYYGSSKNIEKRWIRHKNVLKNNKHNPLLQRAWDKYGKDNFIFEVVELCDEDLLLLREQVYLDLHPEYNVGLKSSGGDNFTNNPNKENIAEKIGNSVRIRMSLMTEEEKKEKFSKPLETNPNWKGGTSFKNCKCGERITPINKTCLKCRDISGNKNPFFGKTHTEETKNKLREMRIGIKPSNVKPILIDGILYESLTEASNELNIAKTTILWRVNSKNKKFENYQNIN
jgi:group I intron endonuclease